MKQFIHGTPEAFSDLDLKCRDQCVVFRRQEMPIGATPATATIGFEGEGPQGIKLFVQLGVAYSGTTQSIRSWFETGSKSFSNMHEAQDWIQDVLASEFNLPSPTPSRGRQRGARGGDSGQTPVPPLSEVTDLDQIASGIAELQSSGDYVDPESLFTSLTKGVRGQPTALRILTAKVSNHMAQRFPRQPATFFAVGPTGVGKTTTAEKLPAVLRATPGVEEEYTFLRLDMSEYQEAHRVSQLIGSPQGYVGYGDGAQLLDTLSANPRCIVLFDEIEKAHPSILTLLMNAIDAGRLSRPTGTGQAGEIDCRKAIFYFTSNLRADAIVAEIGAIGDSPSSSEVNRVCRNHLKSAGIRPEILGRIGAFLPFLPLAVEAQTEILVLAVQRAALPYGLSVQHIDPTAIVWLHSQLSQNDFGVRPVEQLVEESLGPLLAQASYRQGGRTISILGQPVRVESANVLQ